MNKSDIWKRDKQQIMTKIQADAEANNEPLSEDVLEMIELVLDMENKAYEAGYKKGLADARKEMSEYSKTGRVEME